MPTTATIVGILAVILALPVIIENYVVHPHYHVHSVVDGASLPAVLITGASSGIGKHAAMALAKEHNWLVLAGVRKDKDAVALREESSPS